MLFFGCARLSPACSGAENDWNFSSRNHTKSESENTFSCSLTLSVVQEKMLGKTGIRTPNLLLVMHKLYQQDLFNMMIVLHNSMSASQVKIEKSTAPCDNETERICSNNFSFIIDTWCQEQWLPCNDHGN